ncbi:hypothetical protein CTZ28_22620 [Streptomyces shenzhenensis]|uniref:Uncharacterized protein n=1 Tax=Streptomyces shenzhenensis TaxID=943815 RepID=A0A3M0IAA6_9ACTN|nr:hypothetical protein CTZ28_22620 [Streptomyces shenzhenensis]
MALWISIRAQRDGRRSANAAEASVEEARLSRMASERSATVAEETLADQRQEVATRRAEEEEASRPRPDFRIERSGRQAFRLRNTGTGPATGITVSDRGRPYMMDNIVNLTLQAGDAKPFTMLGAAGHPIPSTLWLTWDGQSEEVPVAVPGL